MKENTVKTYLQKILSYLYRNGYKNFNYKIEPSLEVTFYNTDLTYTATIDILWCIEKSIDPYDIANEIMTEFSYFKYGDQT